jgi:hypothetical protein
VSRRRHPIGTQRRRAVAESVAAPERTQVVEDAVAEAPKSKPGRLLVRLIKAGWSLNGNFYPAEVLKRDGATAWPRGTQAFIDHATADEDYERPAGSVEKLAGIQTEDARWDEASQSLVAEVRLIEPWRTPITDMAQAEAEEGIPVIGMSIRAYVLADQGEVDGRRGNIVSSIEQGRSVDFVTKPAAGGAILAILESVQTGKLDEAASVGTYLESRLHLALTQYADDMYADGRLTRAERMTLSAAIGDGLQAWTTRVETDAPQLFQRHRWDDAPELEQTADEAHADDTSAGASAAASADPSALAALAVEVTEMATELDLIDQVLQNSPSQATANADGSPSTAPNHPTEGVSTMSGTAPGAQPDQAGTTNGAPVTEEAAAIVASQLEEFRARANSLSGALAEAQSAQRTAEAQRDAAIAEARTYKGNEAGRLAVDAALADEANGVPESMYASIAPRVHAAVRGNVPMTDDGQVNTEALEALVVASIKAERTYVGQLLESQGVGRPSGLGFSDPDVMTEEAFDKDVAARFQRLGLNESTAHLAAKGR